VQTLPPEQEEEEAEPEEVEEVEEGAAATPLQQEEGCGTSVRWPAS
jgi:hypothetical protein